MWKKGENNHSKKWQIELQMTLQKGFFVICKVLDFLQLPRTVHDHMLTQKLNQIVDQIYY